MKKRFLAISLILLISAFALSACREINMLKKVVVYDENLEVHGVGRYLDKRIVLFIVEENGKDVYFKSYNFETRESFLLVAEKIEGTPNYEYEYAEAPLGMDGWKEGQGLMVYGYLFTYEITSKEFKEKAKALVAFLLEDPKSLMDAMREAAKDLDLIEKPDSLQTI